MLLKEHEFLVAMNNITRHSSYSREIILSALLFHMLMSKPLYRLTIRTLWLTQDCSSLSTPYHVTDIVTTRILFV
jgi:hypothetical protein